MACTAFYLTCLNARHSLRAEVYTVGIKYGFQWERVNEMYLKGIFCEAKQMLFKELIFFFSKEYNKTNHKNGLNAG